MPTFYDSQGNSHALAERLGSGGEGTVYLCPNDFKLVAKIYHEPITDEKAEKLRWMANHKNEQLLKVAAWIVDTLHDAPDGKVVGFLMPNVKAKEIHELYSLKSRRVYFPDATWQFLVHTAGNLARAFHNLHKNRHIMGDINHGNCVVLADGTVKLIDCDSYSISRGDYRYPCEVGVATHLAPELQGVNLREAKREEKHDNFGLAVIIFQLLFLGRHPFSGNFLGSEDKSLEDCIRELRFAYGDGAQDRSVRQPPGTLPLNSVSPPLAKMFERAFLTENRPEPHEWVETLEDLSQNLKQCEVHSGHYFFNQLKSCPWCEIEAKTGLMLFPMTSEKRDGEDDGRFNIFTVESLIASLNIPSNLPATIPKSNALGLNSNFTRIAPTPKILAEKKSQTELIVKFAVAQFFLIAAATAVFGTGFAFISGVITLIFSLVYLTSSHQSIKEDAEYSLELARKEFSKLESEWSGTATGAHFKNDLALIEKKVADYKFFQSDSRQQMKALRDQLFRYKLDLYLNAFEIVDAKISGVEKNRLLVLRSYGIKTAVDVEPKRLQSLPAGIQSITESLLDWRETLERNFNFDQNDELPEAQRRKLTGAISEKQRRFEREIENIFISLRSGAALLRQKQEQLTVKSEQITQNIFQTERDVEAIGTNAPAFAILVVTTFLTLGLSSIFLHHSSSETENYANAKNAISASLPPKSENTNFNSSPTGNAIPTKTDLPEDLTDKKIAAMSKTEKQAIADNLYDSAVQQTFGDKTNYPGAEKKLRLANRLKPNDKKILNQLGEVLYQQQKFSEAMEIFKKALRIDSSNKYTKSSIGMAYLQTNKFYDAAKIFTELTNSEPKNSAWQFNLGLADKGLKKYSSALAKFKIADQLSPNDADTQKEIAECSENLGLTRLKIDKKSESDESLMGAVVGKGSEGNK